MIWGCTITKASVQWGADFSLAVDHLELSADNTCTKIPVMGRSGAGKSTLLNLMAALKWPVRGTVSWRFPNGTTAVWNRDGFPLSAPQLIALRQRHFGFIFQDSSLTPHLRVWENLAYPLELQGVSTHEARRKAYHALKSVLLRDEDLDALLQRFPQQLSGGQRQRVALMQALIHDPLVLFADEPTGNLDGKTREEVMGVLDNWLEASSGERLLVWVTHHDDDPDSAGVTRRLYVADGTCRWQRCSGGEWWWDETR